MRAAGLSVQDGGLLAKIAVIALVSTVAALVSIYFAFDGKSGYELIVSAQSESGRSARLTVDFLTKKNDLTVTETDRGEFSVRTDIEPAQIRILIHPTAYKRTIQFKSFALWHHNGESEPVLVVDLKAALDRLEVGQTENTSLWYLKTLTVTPEGLALPGGRNGLLITSPATIRALAPELTAPPLPLTGSTIPKLIAKTFGIFFAAAAIFLWCIVTASVLRRMERRRVPHADRFVGWADKGFIFLALALAAYGWIMQAHFAVDIPFADDWAMATKAQDPFTVGWVFQVHGPYYFVGEKALRLIHYWLTGLDYKVFAMVTHMLLLGTVGAIFFVIRRGAGLNRFEIVLVMATAPLVLSNHFTSGHSWIGGINLMAACFVVFAAAHIAIWSLNRASRWVRYAVPIALFLIAVFSFGAGTGYVLGIVSTILIVALCRFRSADFKAPTGWNLKIAGAGLVIIVANVLLTQDNRGGLDAVPPWSADFWEFLVRFAGTSFGAAPHLGFPDRDYAIAHGITALLLYVVPLAMLLRSVIRRRSIAAAEISVTAALLGTLAVMAIAAIGRGTNLINGYPYLSYYMSFAITALPILIVAWLLVLRPWPVAKVVVPVCIIAFAFVGFIGSNRWDFKTAAEIRHAAKQHQKQCVLDLVQAEISANGTVTKRIPAKECIKITGYDPGRILALAWEKRLSFLRRAYQTQ